MFVRNIFILVTILGLALSFGGCKKKQADACTDPNCAETKCGVSAEAAAGTTKRELEPQTICPIMGAPIDKTIFVDKGELRIYASEESAKTELAANFDKYVEELKGVGQKPETIATKSE